MTKEQMPVPPVDPEKEKGENEEEMGSTYDPAEEERKRKEDDPNWFREQE